MTLCLLASVLLAVPTPLDCRRQAFTGYNIPPLFRVCAVVFAAVRYAAFPLANFLAATAMLAAPASALGGSGALVDQAEPMAPCLSQSPRALAMLLQPSVEHATVLLSFFCTSL